jgi:hypothetical protein
MSSGRYVEYEIKDGKFVPVKVVEPINEFPDRNADWDNGIDKKNLPEGGSIRPEESIITEANGFKNIKTVKGGGTNNF